jgi:hypothetical protein
MTLPDKPAPGSIVVMNLRSFGKIGVWQVMGCKELEFPDNFVLAPPDEQRLSLAKNDVMYNFHFPGVITNVGEIITVKNNTDQEFAKKDLSMLIQFSGGVAVEYVMTLWGDQARQFHGIKGDTVYVLDAKAIGNDQNFQAMLSLTITGCIVLNPETKQGQRLADLSNEYLNNISGYDDVPIPDGFKEKKKE